MIEKSKEEKKSKQRNKFKVLTEEEFNDQLKKQVNKLKGLFDNKEENKHNAKER